MIRLPFLAARKRDFTIDALHQDDSTAIAELHRQDFARPWSADEFDALLAQEAVFGYALRETGRRHAAPGGFVLARHAAGEGEILTITVSPTERQQGLGRQLMEAVLRDLYARRAEALFLEVDETNTPALALYRRLGFREVGRRPAYYSAPGKPRTAALVMRRDLR